MNRSIDGQMFSREIKLMKNEQNHNQNVKIEKKSEIIEKKQVEPLFEKKSNLIIERKGKKRLI